MGCEVWCGRECQPAVTTCKQQADASQPREGARALGVPEGHVAPVASVAPSGCAPPWTAGHERCVHCCVCVQILLQALVQEAEASLSDCVRKAYEASLKQHHGMIVKGVFAAAVRAVPYRDKFMTGLAATEEEALAKIGQMLPLIEYVLKVNEQYLTSKGLAL